jgi:hypothetical protein
MMWPHLSHKVVRSSVLMFNVVLPVVSLKFNEKRRKWALEGSSDVAFSMQSVENRSEEEEQRHHEYCHNHTSFLPSSPPRR